VAGTQKPQPSRRISQIKNTPAPTGAFFTIVMQRRNSDKRLQNLKPFPKGVSGNPAGRPKKALLSDALRRQLAEALPNATEKTIAEVIARALIREAVAGNVQAIREVGDRTEGKPAQAIALDLDVRDWRQMAQSNGLELNDVLTEARLLIEQSAIDSSGE
jgi:hypothetical protein